ncbi:hypothetical protein [Streptomyces phaeochromogenes]|uniref:hypothetical protein n=1 Tax=Streptomyces phaeochromogenes TaxID=1923 RepID=UPI0038686315|nr:hypothetical protein OG277_26065 [Streptomyces phaeochromogenes]
MSPRPQQRAPKGRNRDRADRRAVVDVLLARAQRGVLSAAEGALLAEHVREEQRLADENRRAMAGTTQALERHREAAAAAIVEAEERAATAEQQLAPVEAALAAARRRHRGAFERGDQLLATVARVRNAQSLGDALAAVAEHDGLSPTAARMHARILDRADSTEARLAEQQREHDIALATERRRGDGWQRHALAADHKADRYRTAWFAARRDRRADRAAMAAELPAVQAGQRALAVADELFVAGRAPAERDAGRRILAVVKENTRP